jgi:hypothetical protein
LAALVSSLRPAPPPPPTVVHHQIFVEEEAVVKAVVKPPPRRVSSSYLASLRTQNNAFAAKHMKREALSAELSFRTYSERCLHLSSPLTSRLASPRL